MEETFMPKTNKEQWAAKEQRLAELTSQGRTTAEIIPILTKEFGLSESGNRSYVYAKHAKWKRERKRKRAVKVGASDQWVSRSTKKESNRNGHSTIPQDQMSHLAHFCPVCGTHMAKVEQLLRGQL